MSMKLLYHPLYSKHETGMHPESKKRLELFDYLPETPLRNGEEYLTLVHTPGYVQMIKQLCREGGGHIDGDTVLCPDSYEVAVHAVGAAVAASETGDFALVRPPGHHAYAQRGSGFCLFNNMAVAAQTRARQEKRVLILNMAGLFGDGTADIFYGTDQVMVWSMHQYPGFPGKEYANATGTGKGKGYTVQIPLPPRSGDDIVAHAMSSFLPIAEQFQPDAVAISAGFDAHQYDLLLDLRWTVNSFHLIGDTIRQYFNNTFAVLEGGYNVEELPRCIENFLAGINGAAAPHHEELTVSGMRVWEAYDLHLHAVLGNLAPHWDV